MQDIIGDLDLNQPELISWIVKTFKTSLHQAPAWLSHLKSFLYSDNPCTSVFQYYIPSPGSPDSSLDTLCRIHARTQPYDKCLPTWPCRNIWCKLEIACGAWVPDHIPNTLPNYPIHDLLVCHWARFEPSSQPEPAAELGQFLRQFGVYHPIFWE